MKDISLKEHLRKASKNIWKGITPFQRSKIMKERAKVRTRNRLEKVNKK